MTSRTEHPRLWIAVCCAGVLLLAPTGCERDSAADVDADARPDRQVAEAAETQVDAEQELARLQAIAARLGGAANASLELFEMLRNGAGASMLSCDLQDKALRADGRPSVVFCKVLDVVRTPSGWRLDAVTRNAAVELLLQLDCDEAAARIVLAHRERLGDNAENGFALVAAFATVERPAFGLRPVTDERGGGGAALHMTTEERVFSCRGRCLAVEHVGPAVQLLF